MEGYRKSSISFWGEDIAKSLSVLQELSSISLTWILKEALFEGNR